MEAFVDNLVVLPITLLTLLAFGAVIRRLLGVRVGSVRTWLAGLLAFLLAGPLVRAMLPDPEEVGGATALLFVLFAASCASLIAMAVLVIGEVIVPDGSLPGPVELWRGWRTRVARTRRYSQIVRIAVRHGLGRFLRGQRHTGVATPADLLHQALLALLAAAAGVMAVLLLGTEESPEVTERLELFAFLGYSLLVVAVVLALRVRVIIFRDTG